MVCIKKLFQAIDYCNKCVKQFGKSGDAERKRFYEMKKHLLYHMIREKERFGIRVHECKMEEQGDITGSGSHKLYAIGLSYDGAELLVHQVLYSKLRNLIDRKGIEVSDGGVYVPKDEVRPVFSKNEFKASMDFMAEAIESWGIKDFVFNVASKEHPNDVVYNSYRYLYPDFEFTYEVKKGLYNHTIIKIIKPGTVHNYVMSMKSLRMFGETALNIWSRKSQFKKFSFCL